MKTLHVIVADKVATYRQRDGYIVCGNSDYQVEFTFSPEWDAYERKIARFIWRGKPVDVEFSGTVCPVPIVANTEQLEVGVYVEKLSTTTSAVIPCRLSILCRSKADAEGTVVIPGGAPVLGEKIITENGDHYPDEGFDGFYKVTVNVPSGGGYVDKYDGAVTIEEATADDGDGGDSGDSGDSGDNSGSGDSGDNSGSGDSGDNSGSGDSGDNSGSGDGGDNSGSGDVEIPEDINGTWVFNAVLPDDFVPLTNAISGTIMVLFDSMGKEINQISRLSNNGTDILTYVEQNNGERIDVYDNINKTWLVEEARTIEIIVGQAMSDDAKSRIVNNATKQE